IERLDAKAEMVEIETACGRCRKAAFLRFDQVEHAIADAKMRHGELGSIRNMFCAQHVTVKSAHGIDVPDPQNQVVDLANLNLCHFASSWVGKRSLMIALSARHSIPVGVNRDCPGLSLFIQ